MRRASPKTRRIVWPARLGREIKKGLALLLRAYDYARSTGNNVWEFALEIAALKNVGLTTNDLRWLVGMGVVEHATEVSASGKKNRSFRSKNGLLFGRRTCFVLTATGVRSARAVCSRQLKPGRGKRVSRVRGDGRQALSAPNYPPFKNRQIKPTPEGTETLVLLLQSSARLGKSGGEPGSAGVSVEQLKAVGLGEGDIGWLVSQGFVEWGQHGRGQKKNSRSLGKARQVRFSEKGSLVLNEAGTKFSRACLVPNYDWELRKFTVGGLLIKRFNEPAPAQETILRAFQELKWAPAMDDPLPRVPGIDPKVRLHDTIKNLNRHHKRRLIGFSVEGDGTRVRWKLTL